MLVIRFTKIGRKNEPKFRIIVKEKRSKRDGKYVDLIGFYDPVASPHVLRYDESKMNHWLSRGAQLSEGVAKIIKLPKKEAKVAKSKTSTKKSSSKVDSEATIKKVAPVKKTTKNVKKVSSQTSKK